MKDFYSLYMIIKQIFMIIDKYLTLSMTEEEGGWYDPAFPISI